MSTFIAKFALPLLLLFLAILAVTGNLISPSPVIIAGQVAALVLIVSARMVFARQKPKLIAQPGEGPLLDRGPYHYIRHPMYAGASLFVVASVIGHPSTISLVVGLATTGLILARIEIEENLLRAHFSGYTEYAKRTKRIIPFLY